MNIAKFLDQNLSAFGMRDKVFHNGRWYTNQDLVRMSQVSATNLIKLGVEKGTKVLVVLPVCPEVHYVFPALWRMGAVVVPLHYTVSADEISRIAELTEANTLISTAEKLKEFGPNLVGSLSHRVSPNDLINSPDSEITANIVDLPPQHPAVIVFTSGSTGKPKGIIQSHENLISLAQDCLKTEETSAAFSLFQHDDCVLLHFASYGHTVGPFLIAGSYFSGAKTVLLDKFDFKLILESIQDHKITQVVGTPTFYEGLIKSSYLGQYDLSSVRSWVTNAAPISETQLQMVENVLGERVYQIYGLSESTSVLTVDRDRQPRKAGSVGRLIAGAEIKFVDEAGNEVDSREGELCIRRRANAVGYLAQDSAEQQRVFKGEWVHTGDICKLDLEGNLFIFGRKSQVINQGGVKVFPSEVEGALEKISGVDKCAVFGLPDDLFGHVVVAAIRPKADVKLSELELQKQCRQFLAEEKVPRFILFLKDFPQTPSKKLDIPALVKWAQAQLSTNATPELTPEQIRQAVLRVLSELLQRNIGERDESVPFMELGLTSLKAVQLAVKLSREIGRALPSTLVFSHSNISDLVNFLSGKSVTKSPRAAGVSGDEPIAIVGYACKFAGAEETEEFWGALNSRRDFASKVPKSRWSNENTEGYFLNSFDKFDAGLFGISKQDAELTDPQHRLFYEICWEALERAGMNPLLLKNTQGGVFACQGHPEYLGLYQEIEMRAPETIGAYSGSNALPTMIAGRLSYILGLQGPSLVVDTACSSSLVAIHLAVQSLRAGECSFAIAGGVNLMFTQYPFHMFAAKGALSPDGRCHTFDEAANGYSRGEGAGVVILKRLSEAIKDGDHIFAVVRGSAVSHGGRASSLTAPNGLVQEHMIRRALEAAGVAPNEVDYVEAHGTGTPLGDPIEVQALANVFSPTRSPESPLVLGSVKTVIGHTEQVAGIAGLIKTLLAMNNRVIPPNLHFKKLNPQLDLAAGRLCVASESKEWKSDGRARVAGISSFGVSGTYSHVIMQEHVAVREISSDRDTNKIFSLSAKSSNALTSYVSKYIRYLSTEADWSLEQISKSIRKYRPTFATRLAVVGKNKDEVRQKLIAWREGQPTAGVVSGTARESKKVAFLFTGQGSQYTGMGRDLYKSHPVFKGELDRCAAILDKTLSIPLFDLLWNPQYETQLNQTEFTQPCLFAFEYAMAKAWMSHGVNPDIVVGHSVGELAAACVAGAMSLEDGLKLIVARGKLMMSLPGQGIMVSALAEESVVRDIIQPYAKSVAIGAINGPTSIVISGLQPEADQVMEIFAQKNIETKRLVVSHASHSPQMDPMLEKFAEIAATAKFKPCRLQMISSVTGKPQASVSASYWRDNVRQPVRFLDSMNVALAQSVDLFIEVGPGAVLTKMGKVIAGEDAKIEWIQSSEKQNGELQFAESLAKLYVGGIVDLAEPDAPKIATLPTYAFDRKSYLVEGLFNPTLAGPSRSKWAFFQNKIELSHAEGEQILFTGTLDLAHFPFLADRVVFGDAIVPDAVFLEMAMEAAYDLRGGEKSVCLESWSILRPVRLIEGETVELQLHCAKSDTGRIELELRTRKSLRENWILNFTTSAVISNKTEKRTLLAEDRALLESACTVSFTSEEIYTEFSKLGFEYGATFRTINGFALGQKAAIGDVGLPVGQTVAPNLLFHPAMLDGCFQLSIARHFSEDDDNSYLSVGAQRLVWRKRPEGDVKCYAKFEDDATGSSFRVNLWLIDDTDEVAIEVKGFELKRVVAGANYRKTKSILDKKDSTKALAIDLLGGFRKLTLDEDREALALQFVSEHVRAVMEWPNDRAMNIEQNLNAMGMDSLASVTLVNRIRKSLAAHKGLNLPTNLIAKYPNCQALSRYLLGQICQTVAKTTIDPVGEGPRLEKLEKMEKEISRIGRSPRRLYLLLHGYGQSMRIAVDSFANLLPVDSSFVAINAPYRNLDGQGKHIPGAYAWCPTEQIDERAMESLRYLRDRMKAILADHSNLEVVVVGFSQGGVLGYLLASEFTQISKVVGVLSPFYRDMPLPKPAHPHFELIALVRREDKVVDFKQTKEGLNLIPRKNVRTIVVQGAEHEVDDDLNPILQDLLIEIEGDSKGAA